MQRNWNHVVVYTIHEKRNQVNRTKAIKFDDIKVFGGLGKNILGDCGRVGNKVLRG